MHRYWPTLLFLGFIAGGLNACGSSETTLPTGAALPPGGGGAPGGIGGSGSGGGASDTTPPQVTAIQPPHGAVGVALTAPITATFSEPIRASSVGPGSFVIRDADGTSVSGAVTASGTTAQFTAGPGTLTNATTYEATLTSAIVDVAGNPLSADFTWSFSTTTDAWQATTTGAVPAARTAHTAVWIGNEMIVWGGFGSTLLRSGGRYDPLQDAWADTNPDGAPSERANHTAVWTGTQMIVWGGDTALEVTHTGGRYTPGAGAGSWTPTPLGSSVPSPRAQHTAVWTGTDMIVWGGVTTGPFLTNTGGRFNPNGGGSWTATNASGASGAPTPRSGHTAVWTGTEMIVWGGNDGLLANSGARYRPGTNDWRPVATAGAPSARVNHTAVWTGGEMIIWGGTDSSGETSTGARYDPGSNTWTAMNNSGAPSARGGHRAIWTGTEMIVWGGDGLTNTGAAYNPADDTWRPISTTNAPAARSGHSAVWTGDEMIVWGGSTGAVTATGGRYTP